MKTVRAREIEQIFGTRLRTVEGDYLTLHDVIAESALRSSVRRDLYLTQYSANPVRFKSNRHHNQFMSEYTSRPISQAGFAHGLTLVSLLIMATPVFAADSPRDRQIVDVHRFPWSSIGKVSSAGEHCTGVVIGADQFLTAAHCLYMPRTGHYLLPGSINFFLGYEKDEYRTHSVASRYTVPPGFNPALHGYSPNPTNYLTAERNDWAIVYTAERFPSNVEPLRLASTKPSPGTAVEMGGYPAESLYALTADQHCQVTELSSDEALVAQNCITHSGDSGGPLLKADELGVIVGLQVLGYSLLVQLREQSKEGGVAVSAANITKFLNQSGREGR